MRQLDGIRYLKLARQAGPTHEDVLLFEEWRDAASLYAWVGDEIGEPRLLEGARELVERVEVTHYESLDVDPDMVWGTAYEPAPPDDPPEELGTGRSR